VGSYFRTSVVELWRDLALDQQLGKLPALRFALDWHWNLAR
jgi:hypothetical protein